MLHVKQRKKLYVLLNALFTYPDTKLPPLLRDWSAEKIGDSLPDCPALTEPDEPLLSELETAYTSLFVNRLGGVPAPPYGSIYLEREPRLMGTTTQQVLAAYQEAGLALEGTPEPPDHLPTELEYLYFLVSQEEQALRKGDVEAARVSLRRQAAFFHQFFQPWIAPFCENILREPEAHPLYRWGASLLQTFAALEQRWLEAAETA